MHTYKCMSAHGHKYTELRILSSSFFQLICRKRNTDTTYLAAFNTEHSGCLPESISLSLLDLLFYIHFKPETVIFQSMTNDNRDRLLV